MRARLGAYCKSPYSVFYDHNPHLNRVVHQHMTYADFSALPESRLGYFTAAFVRNPYDRVYSGFRQLQKDLSKQPFRQFTQPAVKAQVMKQLAANYAQLSKAGFEFNAWLRLVEDRQIYDSALNSSFPLYPAHYWTHRGGERAVDFIGRVEQFEGDFAALCSQLGIEKIARINDNVDSNPAQAGLNAYKHTRHMDAGSIAIINRLFEDDFELFGYARL